MTFKEFKNWCNYRAMDGCWSMNTARLCIYILEDIRKTPFWRRKKRWKIIANEVEEEIVNPINEKINRVNCGESLCESCTSRDTCCDDK